MLGRILSPSAARLARTKGPSFIARAAHVPAKSVRGDVEAGAVPSVVHDVLRAPGQPLDVETRTFMQHSFGFDFSKVRIHSDPLAARSASAVNSLAYTAGRDIVFGEGQFSPSTLRGKNLLAHELAHVMQQDAVAPGTLPQRVSSPYDQSERAADALANAALGGTALPRHLGAAPQAVLSRRVGNVNCPPNTAGAPADPRAALDAINVSAVDFATRTADALAADAATVATGIPANPSASLQAFQNNFGLPVAVGRGFMNRLTGQVRPSLETALREELLIVSRRFRFSARFLNGTVHFRCPGGATVTLPGCGAGSCGTSFAFSCRGGGTIALCETFWTGLDDPSKAITLIHESLHVIFGPSAPRQIGEIGEDVQRGSGRNFNVAGCYEFVVDGAVGTTTPATCPPVP
jgi:hypothetical protein